MLFRSSSDRYGQVDRSAIGAQSRTNSLTSARLDDLSGGAGYGAYPAPNGRRVSQSPGNALSPGPRPGGRPSPPNGYAPNGMPPNGRPSPPGMNQPGVPQHVEQHAGVSNLYPPKSRPQVRSLTGSASNSSAALDSENSAHSSQSSLGPRPPVGVR